MATTTITSITELILTEIIESTIINFEYAPLVAIDKVRMRDLRNQPTRSASFPKWADISGGVSAPTEGAALTSQEVTLTDTVLTSEVQGIYIDLTDQAAGAGIVTRDDIERATRMTGLDPSVVSELMRYLPYANQGALAVYNQIETDILAEAANFGTGNEAGTTTVDARWDQYIDAVFLLESNNAPRPYVAFLHPRQIADLRTTTTSNESGATIFSLLPDSIKEQLNTAAQLTASGFVANVLGVDLYQSTLVPEANGAGVDRRGMFMPTGGANDTQNLTASVGVVFKEISKLEIQRVPEEFSTKIVVGADFEAGVINDVHLVALTTDA